MPATGRHRPSVRCRRRLRYPPSRVCAPPLAADCLPSGVTLRSCRRPRSRARRSVPPGGGIPRAPAPLKMNARSGTGAPVPFGGIARRFRPPTGGWSARRCTRWDRIAPSSQRTGDRQTPACKRCCRPRPWWTARRRSVRGCETAASRSGSGRPAAAPGAARCCVPRPPDSPEPAARSSDARSCQRCAGSARCRQRQASRPLAQCRRHAAPRCTSARPAARCPIRLRPRSARVRARRRPPVLRSPLER